GVEMHARAVPPDEERSVGLHLPFDEIDRRVVRLVVDGLHSLPGERAGVLDGLLADLAEARIDCRIIPVCGFGLEHAPRTKPFFECRVLRIVGMLRLLFGVKMIEIAEELVEPVRGWQEFIAVAEMVLSELAGGVA